MGVAVLARSLVLGLLGVGVLQACMLHNITLHMERHECHHCLAINTTICSGLCYSQDTNIKEFVGKRFLIQRGCIPQSVEYHVATMSRCPNHINPLFFYPVAQRCHCSRCNTDKAECVPKTRMTFKCSKPLHSVNTSSFRGLP
ncbi:thyrotropin subunit beta-like [Denticeps clupeoides]|uniref:Glycoprotein hormone subunit beta domain-containing protein n=1 Tax=Denticeps clupeoides TaxID=299321 RepID=A0AAY4CN42_9TELE|nr:thyrotropin subunit beta-like [Denticeps clupeoides]